MMVRCYTLVSEAYEDDAHLFNEGVLEQVEFGEAELDEDGVPDLSAGAGYVAIRWGADPDYAMSLKMTDIYYAYDSIHEFKWTNSLFGDQWYIGISWVIKRFPDLADVLETDYFECMQPSEFCTLLEQHGFKNDKVFYTEEKAED